MSRNLKTAIIGIIVALLAGLAVNYGLISQQTADEIKAKTDEVLTNEQQPDGSQQPAPQAPNPPQAEPSQVEPTQAPTSGPEPAQPAN